MLKILTWTRSPPRSEFFEIQVGQNGIWSLLSKHSFLQMAPLKFARRNHKAGNVVKDCTMSPCVHINFRLLSVVWWHFTWIHNCDAHMCSVASTESDSETLQTVACQAPLSMDSPGKNTRIGCHALLQGSSQPREQTHDSCISCIAGRFFTVEPPINLLLLIDLRSCIYELTSVYIFINCFQTKI